MNGNWVGGFTPSAAATAHLAAVPEVSAEDVAAYRRDGHVVIRGAIDPAVLREFRDALVAGVKACWPADAAPMEERADVYSQAFVQVVNVSLRVPAVGLFTAAPRVAGIAAQLMGVAGVRRYSEDWLVKEPGARFTPWHQDGAVFPFESWSGLTAWIAIEDMLPDGGLLRVAAGSQRDGIYPHTEISMEFHQQLDRYIAERGYEVRDLPPLRAGDVSFHDARTIHGAHPNRSDRTRWQLALHMFADGAVVREPNTPWMAHALGDLGGGARPGEPAASPAWALLYPPAR